MSLSERQMTIEEIRGSLITTEKGGIRQCIDNVRIALSEDPVFKGKIKLNMLTDRCDIVGDVGWYREGVAITDADFDHIMYYLEMNYSLTSERKIRTAITIVANSNKYHPIQDTLNAIKWDGVERIKDVLHVFFGADQNQYTYEAMRLFLLGAITRVFKPGAKFEYMLILVGGQGAGKSTFFRFLALKDEWFTDDLKNLTDENVYRKLQGHWIVEISEMIATANARSIEDTKSFLSRLSDNYKVPYERYAKDRPRQCVFGGSSNNLDMLPFDRTGNRRFLPILCHEEKAERHILDNEAWSREYISQVMAEAMEIYRSGEVALTLGKEATAYLKEYQLQFMPEDTDAGMIQEFLDNYKGNRVCTKLLWKEALCKDFEPKKYELNDIGRIMNHSIDGWKRHDEPMHFPIYGKQRGWVREDKPDKEEDDSEKFHQVSFDDEIPFH